MKCYQIFMCLGIVTAASLPLNAQTAAAHTSTNAANVKPIKITGPKLGPINYGAQSLEYWLKKMKPGDARRVAALERDHRKLMTRFQRLPKSPTAEYQFVAQRIKLIGQQIKAKAKPTQQASLNAKPATQTASGQKATGAANA